MDFKQIEHIAKKDFSLSGVSSMRTGGVCDFAFFPENEEELCFVISYLKSENRAFYLLGNTSNVLLPDDCKGLSFVFTTKMNGIRKVGECGIYALCGTPLTSVSVYARNRSLTGAEFLHGIPGTVGGAVFMNAGAYGGEISSVLVSVTCLDINDGSFYDFTHEECLFSYRKSIFQQRKELVIISATFELSPGNRETIRETCEGFMASRKAKQPLEYPSCGSAFKRPEGNFAGRLIEECGLKGHSVGGAAISEKHAGFIINKGGATSEDVKNLICEVQTRVNERFGILLEPEIEIIENRKQ